MRLIINTILFYISLFIYFFYFGLFFFFFFFFFQAEDGIRDGTVTGVQTCALPICYLLTGDEFNASEALRIGLVQEVVEPGQQLARAIELAQVVSAQAPLGEIGRGSCRERV